MDIDLKEIDANLKPIQWEEKNTSQEFIPDMKSNEG